MTKELELMVDNREDFIDALIDIGIIGIFEVGECTYYTLNPYYFKDDSADATTFKLFEETRWAKQNNQ